ncbi:Hypothetical_protein [Hexamita inflata]|uniref:Hypothetical_protein n=1 Tax=Hexamita inflata TaxID=28002 RepID=A0AA86QCD1_9EUKA|nr:Hypothetical protein HINF_LOCUS44284 [Hexamita inflata]
MPVSDKVHLLAISSQICNKMLQQPNVIEFCFKEYSLTSRVQTANISHSPANTIHFSLYTQRIQSLVLNLVYQVSNSPSFALFGITSKIQLQSSNMSVNVPQQLYNGSLICFACDINASSSDFTFITFGQNVSGIVLVPLMLIRINQSLIQFRLNGINIGGLVLNAANLAVFLAECNISGYGDQLSVSGSVIAFVFEQVYLYVEKVKICANAQNVGQGALIQAGVIAETCQICGYRTYTYGLCQNILEFGKVENDKQVCSNPFRFDGERCSCQDDEVQNGTSCINIVNFVNSVNTYIIEVNNSVTDLNYTTSFLENATEMLIESQYQIKEEIQSLQNFSEQTQNRIIASQILLQQYIKSNFTEVEINTKTYIQRLDNTIYDNVAIIINNISTVNTTFLTVHDYITNLNQTIINDQVATEILSQNISQLNQIINDSNHMISQQQLLLKDLSLQVLCLNNGFRFTNQQCITNYTISTLVCSQNIYISVFDIAKITNKLNTTSFESDYVFSNQNIVQNAYLDICGYVYTTVKPLFQSQNIFTNLKIQLGAQIFNGGSLIISYTDSILINQMIILSKSTSQITLNEQQLNIITSTSTSTNINNLQVYLSFAPSNGNITLISDINGVFNISGYQILGEYISTQTISMIGLKVKTVIVNINYVSFKPSTYNVGNFSSYLIGSSISSTNSLFINNLAIIIGSCSNFQVLSSISTNDQYTKFYLFGGIIAYVNGTSTVNVTNVIIDAYQVFNTNYISYSGFLFGYIDSTSSSIIVENVCLQQNMSSTSLKFYNFGIYGDSWGSTFLLHASVVFSVQGSYFNGFGMIGVQASNSKVEANNLRVSVTVDSVSGQYLGSVFGFGDAKNCTIFNAVVVSSFSSGLSYTGGFIGGQSSSLSANCTFVNSSVSNTSIQGQGQIGGFIGDQYSNVTIRFSLIQNVVLNGLNVGGFLGVQNANVTIYSSSVLSANISGSYLGGIVGRCKNSLHLNEVKIQFVRISGSNFGVVAGISSGAFYFSGSFSRSNYLNGTGVEDCAVLESKWFVNGC